MLEFKKSDCGCIICGDKDSKENEQMRIIRDNGDSLNSFTLCKKWRIKMTYELDSHNKDWDN
ncbi:MAG: hypothetical protein H2212_08505 [Ruminococcus sp.]|nr:hypothetical protein [Ruminococcus sp.]